MREDELVPYASEVLGFPVEMGMPVRIDVSCTGHDAVGRSRLAPRGSVGFLDAICLRPGNAGLTVLLSIEVDDAIIVARFDEEDTEPQFLFGPIKPDQEPVPVPAPESATATTPGKTGIEAAQKAA